MRTFHDAVVLAVTLADEDLHMKMEGVSVYSGEKLVRQESGVITVKGVSSCIEDGKPVSRPTIDFSDGSVLRLRIDPHELYALIEWESYQPRQTQVAEYTVRGRSVAWHPV